MKITLADYYMGRDQTYALAFTPELQRKAQITVDLVNQLLDRAERFGLDLERNPSTGSIVISGWRPPELNAATPNAAPKSRHMSCEAVDLYDPEGSLDNWLMSSIGQSVLKDLGLWMEHPSATKNWCHLQIVPPRSGNRVFYP